jgi:hypothetical protein
MSLQERIAAALGWPLRDVQSMSLQSVRDLVRSVDPGLAMEISETIDSGAYITRGGKRHALKRRYGHAHKKYKRNLDDYERQVETMLVNDHKVRPGEALVLLSNHGSFLRDCFNDHVSPADAVARIVHFHTHESNIPWGSK